MKKNKIGLVLEGGGMRGIYTAGVLDVFLDRGIAFDGVIGVSAGAIHGASYLSAQKGRGLRYTEKYCSDPRFMSFRSLLTTGNIVGEDFCYRRIPQELEPYDFAAFRSCGVPLYAGVTNLLTGEAEYIRIEDMLEQADVLRASSSLPFVSKNVFLGDTPYLDGCCADSIPVEGFMDMGYGRCVVVLTKPQGYVCKPQSRFMTEMYYKKYPAFRKALLERHNTYNRTISRIEELERQGRVFVIRPSQPTAAGKIEHDPEKIRQTHALGVSDGERLADALSLWLESVSE